MREVPGRLRSQITVYGDKRQIVMQNQNERRKALCSCYGKIKLCDDTTRAGMTMLPSAFILLEKGKGRLYHIWWWLWSWQWNESEWSHGNGKVREKL